MKSSKKTSGKLLFKTPTAIDATIGSPKKNPRWGDSGSLAQEVMDGGISNRENLGAPTSDQLTLFPVDSHASRSATQESEKAQKMIASSGLKCYELSLRIKQPSTRSEKMLGSLAKTLLGSSAWKMDASLMGYSLTWKMRGIRGCRFLFQLAVLGRGTDAIGSGLWGTPQHRDYRTGAAHRTDRPQKNLNDQVLMFPTPQTQGLKVCENGKTRPMTPEEITSRVYMFPTPDTQNHRPGTNLRTMTKEEIKEGNNMGISLHHAVENPEAAHLFPTPTANDWKGQHAPGSEAFEKRKSHSRGVPLTQKLQRDGHIGKLNPTWVEGLMGYPLGWTDIE